MEQELADRAVAERRESYAAEVRSLVDAAFRVMSRTGEIDPAVRDIVKEAGLSNQAFYRHFASKDALLLAVLADGQRQLVDYLRNRVDAVSDRRPEARVEAWVAGVLAQARDATAARATRPFALNGARLAARFPRELATTRRQLLESLTPSVVALGASEREAELVRDLALARMNDAIAHGRAPTAAEVRAVVAFCLDGLHGGAARGA